MTSNILIVDDEPNNLDVLRNCLREAGFKVLVVKSGAAALKRVNYIKPDMILLDVMMPEMDGFETCRCLKKNEVTKDTPIIFISAKTESVDKVEGLEIGAVDYISKPFQVGEVIARINKHLTIHNLQKQLKAKNAELRQNEEQLRKFLPAIEQSASTILITDINGIIEFVNPAFSQTTGYSYTEAIGQNPCILKSGKQPTVFYKELWITITNSHTWRGEMLNKRKNGEIYWVFATISPIKDTEGKITHYVAITEEITQRKQAEEQLQQALKSAEQAKEKADLANRAKSEFLANMSHEIRTPLNAVIGFSDILATKITDKQHKSHLKSIQTAGKSLLTLINDILDLSKIEAGRLEIQYEPVNPQLIFTELQQIFSQAIAEKNLELIIEIDETLPSALFLDETRLRQMLLNLIGNAIKFTDSGYIKFGANKIYTENDHSKVDLILAVEDSGIGIPADQQAVIFESFQQQDGQSTRKYGGTGLGLAITKRIVEMMKGQISVESTPGKGSRFEIALHDVKVAVSQPTIKQDNTFSPNNITFEKVSVLVVDDIESNRYLIKEYLSQVNLELISAENGQEALLFVAKYHPALILMDIRMPEMNGYEATKLLKDNPNTADIPIIALTATLDKKAKLEAHGFDGYLAKPVNISDLLGELSRHLKYTKNHTTLAVENKDIDILANLTPSEKARLPELIETLEKTFLPQWENLHGALYMDEIEEFAKSIIRLGDEYHISGLIHYAKNLSDFAQSFDITNIKNTLSQFPQLIESLKKC